MIIILNKEINIQKNISKEKKKIIKNNNKNNNIKMMLWI